MRYFYSLLAALIVFGIFATAPSQAAQGYEIMSSNIDSLKRGQKFPEDGSISLPLGAEITFLTPSDGKAVQRVCVGPYNGPISSCKGRKKPSFWCRLTGRCGTDNGTVVGGQRGPVVGGTRGVIVKPAPKE